MGFVTETKKNEETSARCHCCRDARRSVGHPRSFANAAEASAAAAAAVGATTPAGNASAKANADASATAAVTIDNIDTTAPFGDLTVDPTQTPDQVFTAIAEDRRPELENRCQVVVDNSAKFEASTATWCQSYLDWKKKM